MNETLSLGAWMKRRRRELDLTQEALAERASCSWETVRKIEAGTLRPSRQLAELLAIQLAVLPAERADFVRWMRVTPLPATEQQHRLAAPLAHPRNLPLAPSALIGRAAEVVRLRQLLQQFEVRLVTLVGPPGIGKTRLALAVATSLRDEFADGVWFVELAPLTDAELVLPAIAGALGVTEDDKQTRRDKLLGYLHEKQVLLVLDNFEHLPAAATLVDALMRAAPGLKVLATSRIPLRLYGEREYPVPPLRFPDARADQTPDVLGQYDAIQLFTERAREVQPDFALISENAGAVAQICVRLDGLPLAIELAAGRVRLFPPPALLARLAPGLLLLTGGARNLPARHQTLRGAIAWSYDLLPEAERQLFRRLAVFQGGCTLEAIAADCNAQGDLQLDVLDGIESLVEKNLLQQGEGREGEPRFGMLETIHEYAWEQLAASGEEERLRLQQARYLVQIAEAVDRYLTGDHVTESAKRLEEELANIRAALEWLLAEEQEGSGEKLALGLRLVGALWALWLSPGYAREGRRWVTAALARHAQWMPGAIPDAEPAAFQRGLYKTLISAGHVFWSYDDAAARDFFAQSLTVSREMNDPNSICMSLLGLGVASWDLGDAGLARASYEECLIISRASGDQWSLNQALNDLGGVALETGDYPTARSLHEESLQGRRAMGQKGEVAQTLINLGDLAYLQGDYEAARAYLHESLRLLMQIGDKSSIANLLGVLAGVEAQRAGSAGMLSPDLASTTSREQPAGGEDGARAARLAAGKRAARLVGAAMAWLEAHEEQLQRVERGISEQGITRARALLGAEEFERIWQEGRALTLEEAASYALEEWEEGKT
jgi:predicted ATPase/DNA-binding XRE family transcriptional regulator